MAIIPEFFMTAVVALGIDSAPNKKHWIGTGFIVSRKEKENPNLSTFYIVTNKHVAENHKYLYVRFNALEGNIVKDYKVDLRDQSDMPMFSIHPHKETDVLAFQINPTALMKDKSIWTSFDIEDHTLTLEQMQATGVTEGSFIYALGFPMNLVDTIKAPICRIGCISRITDTFILKNQYPTFLVDAQTFPGNSGGPIVNRPEFVSINGTPNNKNANLIGILSAYIPYREILFSRQTGRERMIQEENSGLTIVHPVDRIKEVVELEWKRMNSKIEERKKALVAHTENLPKEAAV